MVCIVITWPEISYDYFLKGERTGNMTMHSVHCHSWAEYLPES